MSNIGFERSDLSFSNGHLNSSVESFTLLRMATGLSHRRCPIRSGMTGKSVQFCIALKRVSVGPCIIRV